ncbi:MAG: SpoIIE family protein phosphatase [Actinomycetota bacterium]|nr:SpoIIE family protein phosphatase [Actinomycetota bacterium]MDQ6946646.1 SpoIIE family protein phosphatase [Actinomycetota bacterium]
MTAIIDNVFPDESARLLVVRRYEILDTPPDGAFDRITALAARLFGVPIAIVSVVDTDRIWFKSHHGLPEVSEIGRDPGLCASVILQDGPVIVKDAAADHRTLANPLVAGSFGLRFYAGVPLTTHDGYNLGTLCVIDREPREVTATEMATLEDLAGLVMDQLELRLAARRTITREERLRHEAEELADALQASLLPPRAPDLPGMELATRYLAGEQGLKVGGDFFDVFRLASNDWGIVLGDACGKGARPASLAALARWTIRASSVHHFNPSDVLCDVNAAILSDNDAILDGHFCSAVFSRLELDTCGAWLTLATAGHPLPVLVRRSRQVEFRGRTALPLGMFDAIEPVDVRVGLGPGDALVFYTDGITEARSGSGETFGEDRLIGALLEFTGMSADEIADGIIESARRFAGDSFGDDVAILVVRVPDDAGDEPLSRVSEATGLPVERLKLPGYHHG